MTRLKFFREVLAGKVTWKSGLLLTITFGLLSIFGPCASREIVGAKANVRDLGPMIVANVLGMAAFSPILQRFRPKWSCNLKDRPPYQRNEAE